MIYRLRFYLGPSPSIFSGLIIITEALPRGRKPTLNFLSFQWIKEGSLFDARAVDRKMDDEGRPLPLFAPNVDRPAMKLNDVFDDR